jgi:hypothetical protein
MSDAAMQHGGNMGGFPPESSQFLCAATRISSALQNQRAIALL